MKLRHDDVSALSEFCFEKSAPNNNNFRRRYFEGEDLEVSGALTVDEPNKQVLAFELNASAARATIQTPELFPSVDTFLDAGVVAHNFSVRVASEDGASAPRVMHARGTLVARYTLGSAEDPVMEFDGHATFSYPCRRGDQISLKMSAGFDLGNIAKMDSLEFAGALFCEAEPGETALTVVASLRSLEVSEAAEV